VSPDEPVQQLDDAAQWRIYQMMNKSNSELTPLDLDPNPLEPFVLPAALAVLVAAGVWRMLRYRYQLQH